MIVEYQFQDGEGKVIVAWPGLDIGHGRDDAHDDFAKGSEAWKAIKGMKAAYPGAKLVRVVKESEADADRARLDWIQQHGMGANLYWPELGGGATDEESHLPISIRAVVDKARNAPQPKITVIEDTGKEAK